MTDAIAGTFEEDSFEGHEGLRIWFRSWRPRGEIRAAVAIVPGFNSHSGYYHWAAQQLIADHLAVFAIDLRGRGKSDGERFYIDTFRDYVDDVARLIDVVRLKLPQVPVFLLGHSAGGVVSCIYALDHQDELAGLICESFAFEVPAPDLVLAVLKGISHLAPHAHVLRLRNEDFSRDPKVVETMNSDPLTAHETQPTQTVAEMVRTDALLRREIPYITLPLLVLHGTDDRITKPSGSQHLHDHAGSRDRTLKLYDGHYHDLLNDIGKEEVMADIKAWIAERLDAE